MVCEMSLLGDMRAAFQKIDAEMSVNCFARLLVWIACADREMDDLHKSLCASY